MGLDENPFEGSLVLERLAEIGKLDEFYAAVDSDDFKQAERLMRLAKLDDATIRTVLQKMLDSSE